MVSSLLYIKANLLAFFFYAYLRGLALGYSQLLFLLSPQCNKANIIKNEQLLFKEACCLLAVQKCSHPLKALE